MKLVRINGAVYGVGANGRLQRQLQSAKKVARSEAVKVQASPSAEAAAMSKTTPAACLLAAAKCGDARHPSSSCADRE